MNHKDKPPKSDRSPRVPINVAARRSGLTAHVIRAWERRYEAVKPDRTAKSRRLYSDWEVQRLVLLRQAVELGHRISEVANLPMEELHALVGRETMPGVEASPRIPLTRLRLVEVALQAVWALDSQAFAQSLLQATRTLSVPELFDDFAGTVLEEIGNRWRQGALRIAHEHFASAHLRTFLGDLLSSSAAELPGPCVVVTTPSGQMHELGALMAAITACRVGWHAIFLGPALPPEEIAFVVRHKGARAVAISLSYPVPDADLGLQLKQLRSGVGSLPIFCGGAGAGDYADELAAVEARVLSRQADFGHELQALLRHPPDRAARPAGRP
jgi:DNA-binding transcriptional MerR regulator